MDDGLGASLVIAAILGFIPAIIAHYKNRNFFLWWFYGWLCWIIATIVIICLKPLKTCPNCSEKVKQAAIVCRHCGSSLSSPTTVVSIPVSNTTNTPSI